MPGSLVGDPSTDPGATVTDGERSRSRRPTFAQRDSRLARYVARPVQQFLHVEAAGGIVLLAATIAALVWANSAWRAGYRSFFGTEIALTVGSFDLSLDLTHWINDGLMALFFLVVGLEIKREWVVGELRDRRAAALPMLGALGGMVAPAALYLLVNPSGPARAGWGIPMATDIAFALGVVSVLGRRVPTPLKVFLLTLAVVDDIGAIVVIAVAYTDELAPGWLAGGAALVLLVLALRRVHVVYQPVYVAVGLGLWLCAYEAGIHPTLACVIMGLLAPALPFQQQVPRGAVMAALGDEHEPTPDDAREAALLIRTSVPVTEELTRALHPWTSYVIVPLFALANAGIVLHADGITSPEPVTLGVVLGLVVGKTIGITAACWLAARLGLGRLPTGTTWSQLVGIAMLAGIGFTVSLFVAGLAFDDVGLVDDAKTGILMASVLAAGLGSVVLSVAGRARRSTRS